MTKNMRSAAHRMCQRLIIIDTNTPTSMNQLKLVYAETFAAANHSR